MLVSGAGHLLSVTHGQAVNQFIAERMRKMIGEWS
jgi:hypothetical protein